MPPLAFVFHQPTCRPHLIRPDNIAIISINGEYLKRQWWPTMQGHKNRLVRWQHSGAVDRPETIVHGQL
jgi:hypothetical protein